MTKKKARELLEFHKRTLKMAEDRLEFSEGTRVSSCSMSYDVGYWTGIIHFIETEFLGVKR